jgi:hypothetical protein
MHFCVSDIFCVSFLGFGRAGKVSIGIYKGLNFQRFTPKVLALILSCYLLLSLKISEDGKDGKA